MKCEMADCSREAVRKTFCWMHYARVIRTGSPEKKERWIKERTEINAVSNVAYIGLTKGKQAVVDLEDFERINKHKYHANIMSSGKARARRTPASGLAVYMHHDVLGVMPWDLSLQAKEVDHINGDCLDNRKCNLRMVSHQENMLNREACKNRVGVSFNARANLWMAYIDSPYEKRRYLGYRKTREEAVALLESAKNANN